MEKSNLGKQIDKEKRARERERERERGREIRKKISLPPLPPLVRKHFIPKVVWGKIIQPRRVFALLSAL